MKIEVWADIVCPWCYIGRRRLGEALELFAHRDELDVIYRSFQLDPNATVGGVETMLDHLSRKFNTSPEATRESMARVMAIGATVGLELRLEDTLPVNSLSAHRISHLGREQGVQEAVIENLMRSYFTECRDIQDANVLVEAATSAGIDESLATKVLESDAYVSDVELEHSTARELGITGVPFVVVDKRIVISGAQSADVILDALQEAWESRTGSA